MQNKLTIFKAEEGELFQNENDNDSSREIKGDYFLKFSFYFI